MVKKFAKLLLLVMVWSCHSSAQPDPALSPEEFEQKIAAKNTQLLDVRTASEYQSGYLPNSLQADWNRREEFKARVQHLDTARPLYVYCASGVRSKAAARWLRQQGFKAVWELNGGLIKWKAAGKPVAGRPEKPSITPTEIEAAIRNSPVVLVNVGAPWCPPCRKMEPVMQQLQQDMPGKFTLVKVNADTDGEVMKKLGDAIELPTFIVYRNGREVWRRQGIVSSDALKKALE